MIWNVDHGCHTLGSCRKLLQAAESLEWASLLRLSAGAHQEFQPAAEISIVMRVVE